MKNTFKLHKICNDFCATAAAAPIAAAIESRVLGAREAGLHFASKVSSPAPQMAGAAA